MRAVGTGRALQQGTPERACQQVAARCNPAADPNRAAATRSEQVERAAKKELVTSLHGVFKDTGVVVVAHNTGMVAAQSAEFRKRVKEAGGSVKVAKNKLVQLALKDTDAQGISDLMKGPTILAYSKDPIAAAKVAVKYAKENEKLVILG